jgi:pyruvate/2-oxoacid:ferredoxin oxidoreductase beta subunit/pyruvate/2-oxoacid:ferredoxin oxidoreductase alpha subunit
MAQAAILAGAEVIPGYPITPQTRTVEWIAEAKAKGIFEKRFITAESESTVLAICKGASMAGSRVFSASSSQGILYATEEIRAIAHLRLPVVFGIWNREEYPWNLWYSQNDAVSQTSSLWTQVFCENVQEVFDLTILAYRLAEKTDLPIFVNGAGFILSHAEEGIWIPSKERIEKFVGERKPKFKLDTAHPLTFGSFVLPENYSELCGKILDDLKKVPNEFNLLGMRFGSLFSRSYSAVEPYRCEDEPDTLLVTMGADATAFKAAVDTLRNRGQRIGLLKIVLFNPFPHGDFWNWARRCEEIIVHDRNFVGIDGVLHKEIKASLYEMDRRPRLIGARAGLGGRDVTRKTVLDMVRKAREKGGSSALWIDLRRKEYDLQIKPTKELEDSLQSDELMNPGHKACAGCGATIAMRHVVRILGRKTIFVVPACCFSLIGGYSPYQTLNVPVFHVTFCSAASSAAGIRAALDARGIKDHHVVAWAGDGGTYDIGFQALSGAAERNENILYICYNNQAYMNTGAQRSGATLLGTKTATTPAEHGKSERPKDMITLMADHGIPYVATANLAYLDDLERKVRRASEISGFRYLEIFIPCVPGHKIPSSSGIEMSRQMVRSKIWPLLETTENGQRWDLWEPEEIISVEEALKSQGRFQDKVDYSPLQKEVDERWNRILSRVRSSTLPRSLQ